jgi:hypothetical protein
LHGFGAVLRPRPTPTRIWTTCSGPGLASTVRRPATGPPWPCAAVRNGRAEFLLLTLWESQEAIRGFAGPNVERAVFYPEDDRFLLERGERVDHFDVVFSAGDL